MSYSSNTRQRCLARIHIGKAQLGLDNDSYRLLLASLTGKTSCREMSLSELLQVKQHFIDQSRKLRQGQHQKRLSPNSRDRMCHKKTGVDKLRALWITMARVGIIHDGSENALEAWVKTMSARYNHGQGIEKIAWLHREPFVCSRLIECLKQWQKRTQT